LAGKTGQSLKVILRLLELLRYSCEKWVLAMLMVSKDKDIFYLKLQWISSKDENEKKKLAEKIRQALSQRKQPSAAVG